MEPAKAVIIVIMATQRPAQSIEDIYLVRPKSVAEVSKYFNRGPIRPDTTHNPKVLRSVVPAMYKAHAEASAALSHDRNIGLNCAMLSP